MSILTYVIVTVLLGALMLHSKSELILASMHELDSLIHRANKWYVNRLTIALCIIGLLFVSHAVMVLYVSEYLILTWWCICVVIHVYEQRLLASVRS